MPKLTLRNSVPFTVPDGRPVIEGKVDLRGAELAGLRVMGDGLKNADITDATISECAIHRGMTKLQLCSTKNYKDGNLSNSPFSRIDLSGCDLSRQNLTGSTFTECVFTGASFRDAVITNAQFAIGTTDCPGLTVEQIKSTWNYKNGRMAGVVLPRRVAEALLKENDREKAEAKK